jgi:hypothetical protein
VPCSGSRDSEDKLSLTFQAHDRTQPPQQPQHLGDSDQEGTDAHATKIRYGPCQRRKSHGPATAEGREKSSRNAVKHGLFSRNPLVLECETDDDFEALHQSQMEIHQPATPAEKDLVDQMVAACWRILRFRGIESDILDSEMRQKAETEREFGSDRIIHLSNAFITQVNNSQAVALASRCEARFLRMYHSSYKVLREPQVSRMKRSTQPAAPETTQPDPPPPPIAAEAAKTQAASPPTSNQKEQICSNEPGPHPKSDIRNPLYRFQIGFARPKSAWAPQTWDHSVRYTFSLDPSAWIST